MRKIHVTKEAIAIFTFEKYIRVFATKTFWKLQFIARVGNCNL